MASSTRLVHTAALPFQHQQGFPEGGTAQRASGPAKGSTDLRYTSRERLVFCLILFYALIVFLSFLFFLPVILSSPFSGSYSLLAPESAESHASQPASQPPRAHFARLRVPQAYPVMRPPSRQCSVSPERSKKDARTCLPSVPCQTGQCPRKPKRVHTDAHAVPSSPHEKRPVCPSHPSLTVPSARTASKARQPPHARGPRVFLAFVAFFFFSFFYVLACFCQVSPGGEREGEGIST